MAHVLTNVPSRLWKGPWKTGKRKVPLRWKSGDLVWIHEWKKEMAGNPWQRDDWTPECVWNLFGLRSSWKWFQGSVLGQPGPGSILWPQGDFAKAALGKEAHSGSSMVFGQGWAAMRVCICECEYVHTSMLEEWSTKHDKIVDGEREETWDHRLDWGHRANGRSKRNGRLQRNLVNQDDRQGSGEMLSG